MNKSDKDEVLEQGTTCIDKLKHLLIKTIKLKAKSKKME